MNEKTDKVERRKFLSTLTTVAISLAGGVSLFVGAGFLYPVPKRKPGPLFVCLEYEIPCKEALEIKDPKGRKVLLMRKDSGEIMAIGTVCTHLGCAVYYRQGKRIFECPCHQGVFDGEGNPVSGPPRQPLERYPVEVREGKVFVHFA